jgi:uncharacterized membrane protein
LPRFNARGTWIRRLLDRESRMVDMQIMGSLQNGTAFFASTSLIAVGGALALLRSSNEAFAVFAAMPIDLSPLAGAVGDQMPGAHGDLHLRVFQIRLVVPAVQLPPAQQRDTPEAEAHVVRTTRLFETAGRHFNRGQRAFFFALGYLGWFVSPWVLFVSTAAVVIVIWRRQFASNAWRAMGR